MDNRSNRNVGYESSFISDNIKLVEFEPIRILFVKNSKENVKLHSHMLSMSCDDDNVYESRSF